MDKDVRLTLAEWEELRKSNPKEWLEKYEYFMYCNHTCICEECPANRDMEGNGMFPCGQYHCWVDAYRRD